MTTHVYWLYDHEGILLYVGVTDHLLQRLTQHGLSKPWARRVSRIESIQFASRSHAEAVERNAIWFEGPLYNATFQSAETADCRRKEMDRIGAFNLDGHASYVLANALTEEVTA